MRYRAYKKSITREILSSKARFASILVIILLGVAFFSGIKSSGPDMNKAINELYKNQNLMDSKIVSTLGLTDKDLELLKNNDKILDFYSSHTIDANLENINSVVRFMEYDKKLKMDRAAQLLLSTNMKTYEIASQLGYKSVQHFSRIFKEYYNYTPMEYRQRRNMQ